MVADRRRLYQIRACVLLRADNNGEGGTLSPMALCQRAHRTAVVARCWLLGVIGAAMFFGDSMLTPAVTVLSAVEGLKLATPAFEDYVVPFAIVILCHPVRNAKPRHRAGRQILRSGDGRLVRRPCGSRPDAHPRSADGAATRSIRY